MSKGRPHFGNTKTIYVVCDYSLQNFTSKIRFNNKCRKLFRRSKSLQVVLLLSGFVGHTVVVSNVTICSHQPWFFLFCKALIFIFSGSTLLYSCTPVLMYSCTPVLLYSCTLVLLYSCTLVLLYSFTPVLLYSCTPVLLYSCTPEPKT